MKHVYLLFFIIGLFSCPEDESIDPYAWNGGVVGKNLIRERMHYVETEELGSHDCTNI